MFGRELDIPNWIWREMVFDGTGGRIRHGFRRIASHLANRFFFGSLRFLLRLRRMQEWLFDPGSSSGMLAICCRRLVMIPEIRSHFTFLLRNARVDLLVAGFFVFGGVAFRQRHIQSRHRYETSRLRASVVSPVETYLVRPNSVRCGRTIG